MEYYSEICNSFPKLCPRLVPKPLWGLSISRLARLPNYILPLFNLNPSQQKKIRKFWFSLSRDRCYVCNSRKRIHIDEVWGYYLDKREIILEKLTPLCKDCHLSKHLVLAKRINKLEFAINRLCQVNKVDNKTVKLSINSLFQSFGELSEEIERNREKFRIRIKDGIIPDGIKKIIENSLTVALRRGIRIHYPYIVWKSKEVKNNKIVKLSFQVPLNLIGEAFLKLIDFPIYKLKIPINNPRLIIYGERQKLKELKIKLNSILRKERKLTIFMNKLNIHI